MYTPPMFKSDRAASPRVCASARIWLRLRVGWQPADRLIAAVLPRVRRRRLGRAQMAFHVARHNPLVKMADGTSSWLMAVTGADAYVSADWYVSPDQVPTWLYQAVHLTGPVRKLSDNELGPHLDALSAQIRKLAGAEIHPGCRRR